MMWNEGRTTGQPESATTAVIHPHLQEIIDEMRIDDFDSIRFATYRAACKLRFIQKKTNVHKVDIWNMIEAFRENGLNGLPLEAQVKSSRLELLLTTIFHNLNKRLVASQHIDTDRSISRLLAFLIASCDRNATGRLSVFCIKIALATLCAGKLVEKLRYIFSQLCDSSGILEQDRYADFVREALALPAAVFEGPSFSFSETTVRESFPQGDRVGVTEFVEVFVGDCCPSCLLWLPLLHRLASVEHVYHPVHCDACQARSFTGFRYKCQRCANYQLCEKCFWRGRTSQKHSNEHEMKEYSSYKSPSRQLAHSLHKSLQCIPSAASSSRRFHSEEKQPPSLDLSNIIPATPSAIRRLNPELSRDALSSNPSPPLFLPGQLSNGLTPSGLDDEHRLIARYAAKLSGRADFPPNQSGVSCRCSLADRCQHDRQLISRLQHENSDMLREVARLDNSAQAKLEEEDEISVIRERKWQLEEQMYSMQQKRRELITQLEQLIPVLHSPPSAGVAPSAAASLSGSARHLPGLLSSRLSTAFRASSLPTATLQGDLLQAAGDITNNMSSLVRQLDQAQEGAPQPSSTSRLTT